MDLTKAQRLLNKIQAFLDNGNGHELSRLEKDLIKSYVQQLYEAVTSDDNPGQETQKPVESNYQKNQKTETFQKSDVPAPKVETPAPRVTEMPKSEPVKPTYSEYTPPVEKPKPPVYAPQEEKVETPVYSDYSTPEHKTETPVYVEPEIPEPKKHEIQSETKSDIYTPSYTESKTPAVEEVRNTYPAQKEHAFSGDQNEAMQKLFDLQKSDEMSSRFGHVPISSIESAMGLNERIFTLNELFGGDKALFDAWCAKLNSLSSFTEAKNVLMAGPAKDFKWADPQRIKMAEQFIRIVSRRYPKSAN
jgi:hypothetical protein